ncbi:MAG: hypothetical protein RL595_1750 [Planctomycetota bacterium]|jgi:tetratricopeptide (TPR) repeat protein
MSPIFKYIVGVILIFLGWINYSHLQNQKSSECFEEGVKYLNLYELDSAVEWFSKTIKLDPENGEAYLRRGIARMGLKKYPEAIADFTKVIELNPRHAVALCNRGDAFLSLRNTLRPSLIFRKP